MSPTPFVLPPLPLTGDDSPWKNFGHLENKALVELCRLDGMMRASAKADLFWLTWLMKEAQCSNVIEGTVTTFDEVVGENAGIVVPANRRDDVQEVLNYRDAMLDGLNDLGQGRELTLSFIKALHARLLHGARGMNKTPGEIRSVQVHIGRPGDDVDKASYVPPEPIFLNELLENLLAFINRNDLNPLIQTAVMHAQFEMIHPFLDGNGRMGRLLITTFLAHKKILTTPCFYMSSYLQSHRDRYYETLGLISKEKKWNPWIEFFLSGVIKHCSENERLLWNMTKLYEESKEKFTSATNSSFAINILDFIFAQPVFSIPGIHKKYSNMSKQVIAQLMAKLCHAGQIEKVFPGRGRQPSVYKFPSLLQLLA